MFFHRVQKGLDLFVVLRKLGLGNSIPSSLAFSSGRYRGAYLATLKSPLALTTPFFGST